MASQERRRRFTVTDYERMATAGILNEDDRIELVGGEIIEMAAIGLRHVQCVNRLTQLLDRSISSDMLVSVQNPITVDVGSQPQPDLAIWYDRDYTAMPTPPDILLVIEVADSSRDYDRGTKFPIYAAAGIAEAWLVDLVSDTVERHTEPRDGLYRVVTIARPGESLVSTVIASLTIPVNAIFR